MARASAARRAARQAYPQTRKPVTANPAPPKGPPISDAEIARLMGVDPVEDAAEVARMRRAVGPNADKAQVAGVIRTLRQSFAMMGDF